MRPTSQAWARGPLGAPAIGTAMVLCACASAPSAKLGANASPDAGDAPPPQATAPVAELPLGNTATWNEPFVELAAYATKEAASTHARRASQAALGPVRLERHGVPVWAPPEGRPVRLPRGIELSVLERGPSTVRVLRESEDLVVALYVDAGDLERRPAQVVELRPEPERMFEDGAVRLHPGAPVRFRDEPGGLERAIVSWGDPLVRASGYLPREAVDIVFTPADPAPQMTDWDISWPARVYDRPAGLEIATLYGSADRPVPVLRSGPAREDHQPMRYVGDRIVVEGWVRLARDRSPNVALAPLVRMATTDGGPEATLAPRTSLYASATGPAIGITHRATTVRAGEPYGERRRIEVPVPDYGFLPVFVESEALAQPQ